MSDSFLQVFGQVAGIGGLALGVLLVVYRETLRRRIFPQLTRDHAYKIIRLILVLTWTVALVGIGAWVYTTRQDHPNTVSEDPFHPPPPDGKGGPTRPGPPLIQWNRDARLEHKNLGQKPSFRCPPNGKIDAIFGTEIYTYGSSICSAAVHAGLFSAVTGGDVTIKILGPHTGFEPSTRNGVAARAYRGTLEAFEFVHP
jgi:hypothetical protein